MNKKPKDPVQDLQNLMIMTLRRIEANVHDMCNNAKDLTRISNELNKITNEQQEDKP